MSAKAEWANRLNCKDDETLGKVLQEQEESLHLIKKATDQITAFNDFSAARYTQVQKHLEAHTKLLKEIKVDLDSAFRKISTLKKHCQEQHPNEHEQALEKYPPKVIEDD